MNSSSGLKTDEIKMIPSGKRSYAYIAGFALNASYRDHANYLHSLRLLRNMNTVLFSLLKKSFHPAYNIFCVIMCQTEEFTCCFYFAVQVEYDIHSL